QYVDVSNPSAPKNLGQVQFGSGWAWSPAADTFKAFIINPTLGLAVIPFSGWDDQGQQYNNGLELVQFNQGALTGSGTAHTHGWVQRGIFVGNRLYSLSDESMGVVDFTNPSAPQVLSELTLARNVVNAQPQGSTIAELSSDWWGNDTTSSEMRVLPIWDAAETTDDGNGVSAKINGVDAQVFQNGSLSYVVTDVQVPVPCTPQSGGPTGPNGQCTAYTQQVQVVDTSNGGARLRGAVTLPGIPYYGYGGWGWDGYYYYDWYNGAGVVQVGGDALAFRRWYPNYGYGPNGPVYQDDLDALFVVDISNPDAPSIASLTIQNDPTAWWGDLTAVGNTLYATDYTWIDAPDPSNPNNVVSTASYWLEQIDLSDRAHPRIGQHVNVPGVLVGASSSDPSMLYFADYVWDGNDERDQISVCQLSGGLCYLQSVTQMDGYVGNVIVQNDRAYTTVQEYDWMWQNGGTQSPPYTELHQVDLSNPSHPVDRIATAATSGWGWLLGVAGDRAVVTSGWGNMGVDIYQLSDTAAPKYQESVRTLGWGADSLSRQGNTLYLASGYWGVQPITVQ
ncbi:MAG TPA: beta-propeller domain-containing protein, partial [Polyangiaceae bacterium]